MPTSRPGFLGWLGSASLLGDVGAPSRLRANSVRHDAARDDHAPPASETWDMRWTSRLTGKCKAVLDSPEASDGAALYRAVAWIKQYKEVCNAEPADLSAVVVRRHLGFYFVMNDEYWNTALGGTVLVCGWSFGGAASQIAKKESLEKDAARARAKTMLLPGAILQPNGIFAALRAQEAGCSHINAS